MDENDGEKPQDKGQKKKTHDGGAADLEKVTDYEEERVVMSSDITGVYFLQNIHVINSRLHISRCNFKNVLLVVKFFKS